MDGQGLHIQMTNTFEWRLGIQQSRNNALLLWRHSRYTIVHSPYSKSLDMKIVINVSTLILEHLTLSNGTPSCVYIHFEYPRCSAVGRSVIISVIFFFNKCNFLSYKVLLTFGIFWTTLGCCVVILQNKL